MDGHVTGHTTRYLRADDAFALFAARPPALDWRLDKSNLCAYLHAQFSQNRPQTGMAPGLWLNFQ